MSRRLSMYRALSPQLVSQGVIDRMEAGVVKKLSRLPPRNQDELMAVSGHEGLSAAETARLLELWRKAPDAEAKKYVLREPRTALQLARSSPSGADPRLGPDGAKLYESLLVMRQAAMRIVRQTGSSPGPSPVIPAPRAKGQPGLLRANRQQPLQRVPEVRRQKVHRSPL